MHIRWKRYDKPTHLALNKLKKLNYPHAIFHKDTLNREKYLSLFKGAICLLIYDLDSYKDKFSGVTLDAFYVGCPIITTAGTWMGEVATRFNAGIALSDHSPASVLEAIKQIMNSYDVFQLNAINAAKELTKEHDPKKTVDALLVD